MILRAVFVAVVLSVSLNLSALDFSEGKIKLTINERTGGISLYCLANPQRYEPLFNDKEKRASNISVNINGNVYKLGFSNMFRTRVENQNGYPSVVFESLNLLITEDFSPVRTTDSQEANGIKIAITIKNTGSTPVSAGFKMLLDTYLGEKNKVEHFITGRQIISKETLFKGTDNDLFWVSRDQNHSLMGTIVDPLDNNARPPDFVHFANWRRLYNVPWTLSYKPDRSFNYRPYSIRDSAVCYYWEPVMLEAGSSLTYSIYLTTEDLSWYGLATPSNTFSIAEIEETTNDNLLLLYMLQEKLNSFIAGEIYLDEQDLDEIETTINRIKADGF
jgi:hypothetical protein